MRAGEFVRSLFDSDLMAILDAEGIEQTAIICQSMGGWTGLRAAAFHAERVSCLVLSNTPGSMNIPSVASALAGSRREFAKRGVGTAAVADRFSRTTSRSGLSLSPNRFTQYQSAGRPSGRSSGGVTPEDTAGYSGANLDDHQRTRPTLHTGSHPRVLTHIPDATVIELPTAGHHRISNRRTRSMKRLWRSLSEQI